jgi:hypothetical protein
MHLHLPAAGIPIALDEPKRPCCRATLCLTCPAKARAADMSSAPAKPHIAVVWMRGCVVAGDFVLPRDFVCVRVCVSPSSLVLHLPRELCAQMLPRTRVVHHSRGHDGMAPLVCFSLSCEASRDVRLSLYMTLSSSCGHHYKLCSYQLRSSSVEFRLQRGTRPRKNNEQQRKYGTVDGHRNARSAD